ncbi:MAG: hypothetical protein BMS9Abin13_335 [Patescibacteria group bacterium]|nr:MAG: hypothetical protein BMS9Abin13_335 [Patescibacteria group bacterium]
MKYLKQYISGWVLGGMALFTLPIHVSANHGFSGGGLGGVIQTIGNIIGALIPLLIGLGALYFIWGVSKYVLHGEDATKREEGRSMMIYGIIALFVMVSVWGLVNVLVSTFGLESVLAPPAPGLPGI